MREYIIEEMSGERAAHEPEYEELCKMALLGLEAEKLVTYLELIVQMNSPIGLPGNPRIAQAALSSWEQAKKEMEK